MFTCASPGPNYIVKALPADNNLNVENWESYRHIVDQFDPHLIDCVKYGFPMGIDRKFDINVPVTNHKSAREHYRVIDEFIVKHHKTRAILGPYQTNPFPVEAHPSPMQVVFSSSGKACPVVDMSYPRGHSVNDSIPREWTEIPGFQGTFHLPTHDKICAEILKVKDPLMFVTDLSSYFMQISSDICDAPYLCVTWRGALWFIRRLPFGARSACLHAQRVTEAVVSIFRNTTSYHVDGYIDDFCSIVRRVMALVACRKFGDLLETLGLDKTVEKCKLPAELQIFLGLLYDLKNMVLELPPEKRDRCLALINDWLDKECCSKSSLQSLIGVFNHVATVVHAARPLCSNMLDMLRNDTFPAIVTPELREDLKQWADYLGSDFSRKCIIKSQLVVTPDKDLKIAARGRNFIVYFKGARKGFTLSSSVPHIQFHLLFALAVWKASVLHASALKGQVVAVYVPSKAAAGVINRANTQVSRVRSAIREMWLIQARNDCWIKAVHHPQGNNSVLFDEFVNMETVIV